MLTGILSRRNTASLAFTPVKGAPPQPASQVNFPPFNKKTGAPDENPPVTNFSYGGITHIRYKGRRSSFLSACIQAPLYLIYINHIPTIYKLQIFSQNKKSSLSRGLMLYKVDCYFIIFQILIQAYNILYGFLGFFVRLRKESLFNGLFLYNFFLIQ